MTDRQPMFGKPPKGQGASLQRPDLSDFKPARSKPQVDEQVLNNLSDDAGFQSRQAPAKRGRKPSGRTGQLHPKLLPIPAAKIQAECQRRGIQQGVFIEELLAHYEQSFGPIELDE